MMSNISKMETREARGIDSRAKRTRQKNRDKPVSTGDTRAKKKKERK